MWKQRMNLLVKLNFILAEEGTGGGFDYVLLLNPYPIIQNHYDAGNVQKHKYISLFNRSQTIGATDLI